jgi:hypothetical protein
MRIIAATILRSTMKTSAHSFRSFPRKRESRLLLVSRQKRLCRPRGNERIASDQLSIG